MEPPSSPWWRHFFWLVPLGIVVGVVLAFWLPTDEDKDTEQETQDTGEDLKPIKQPITHSKVGPQQQILPGQQLEENGNGTQFEVANRNQIPVSEQFTTIRLPGNTGRDGRQPAADNRGQIEGTPPRSDFDLQVALDRRGFSPGSIDGIAGEQTYAALRAFQSANGLPTTGRLDDATRRQLSLKHEAAVIHQVSTNDFSGLQPLGETWTAKERQSDLSHASLIERLAEQYHCSPNYLRRANPRVDWNRVEPGTQIHVPQTSPQSRWALTGPAAELRISLAARTLQAVDAAGKIIAHFPCSIARKLEARPVGELQVTKLVPNPNYTFDPARFPDTPEARNGSGKLIIAPGPNNPVGTVWIDLSLEGYGIHGTPDPENVGRTGSLGCFRLSNWNAERLLPLVSEGTRVVVR